MLFLDIEQHRLRAFPLLGALGRGFAVGETAAVSKGGKFKMKKRLLSLLLCVCLVLCCVWYADLPALALDDAPQPVTITPVALGHNVSIHSELQEQYLHGPMQEIANYACGTSELSRPRKLALSWNTALDETFAAAHELTTDGCSYTVLFGKTPELSDAKVYTTTALSCEVTNLELNTTYYWQVSTELGGETYESPVSTFTTEKNGPRNLYVSGITNVRDIGGYTTLCGDTVRQGMILRCGQLSNSSGNATITAKGITEMTQNLGVRSEIDLRRVSNGENGGLTESVLGSTVRYYSFPMDYSGSMLEGTYAEDNVASLRGVFAVLADETNYPVIFHCAIGTDRTGMVAYMLEALLGMSETDIIRDYLYSNFGNIGGSRSISTIRSKYAKVVKNYDGATLQEKTYRYLNEVVGVPTEQLDAVLRINLIPKDETLRGEPVSSEEEFMNMSPDGTYYLTNDISVASGYTAQFFGTLDGNGYTVHAAKPLFYNLSGTVKNLTIDGNISVTGGKAGALAREGSSLTCINVKNYAAVTGTGQYYAAGLVGYSAEKATFIDCENHGQIRSNYHAAGIICRSFGELTLENCVNDGNIIALPSAETYYAGGMVAKSSGAFHMQNCSNSGEVSAAGRYVGGLCGYLDTSDVMKTVISCVNRGKVTCTGATELSYVGGIAGYMRGGRSYCTFSYCENTGELTSAATATAILCGICGYVNSASIVISYCKNSGSEAAPNAALCTCYHLYYNPTVPEERFIHDNDIWKYDNVTFTVEGAGSYCLAHEMTFGEWLALSGCSSGNEAVWVSPVTGLNAAQIAAAPEFQSGGAWAAYRSDVQGQLYLERPSHCDGSGNLLLPDARLVNLEDRKALLTINDFITPNAHYGAELP